MSEDDRWSDVVKQVLDALDDADVADTDTRDALAEGVRQALESLETGVGIDVQILGDGLPFPESKSVAVELMEGGRKQEEPRSAGQAPDLRIADPDDADNDESSHLDDLEDDATEPPSMFTHVKVIRGHDQTPTSHKPHRVLPGLAEAGWIHVAGSESPDASWQTVYQGVKPRLYRVACSQGLLDVTADGDPVERLRPGQSIDIEARLIRVTTENQMEAIGGYTPVTPLVGEEE